MCVVLELNFQVRFDGRGDGGRHWASVSLLAYRQDLSDLMELKGKLYGLLGNFDGDIENDLVPRGGSKTGTPTELGNSYQLGICISMNNPVVYAYACNSCIFLHPYISSVCFLLDKLTVSGWLSG